MDVVEFVILVSCKVHLSEHPAVQYVSLCLIMFLGTKSMIYCISKDLGSFLGLFSVFIYSWLSSFVPGLPWV